MPDIQTVLPDITYDEFFLEILEEQLTPENVSRITDIGNSKEKDRIHLIAEVLVRRGGYNETSDILKEQKMRRLYTRSPFEFALVFCLKYNDTENDDKYDLDEFIRLLTRLNIGVNAAGIARKMPSTLSELRDVILKNTVINKENHRETIRYTQNISYSLNNINYSNREDAEKDLQRLLNEKIALMCNAQESIRYYLCKYIYHIICDQLIEMQKIVADLRESSQDYIVKYFEQMKDLSVNIFSFPYQITCSQEFDDYISGKLSSSMTDRQLILYLTSKALLLTRIGLRDKTYLLGNDPPEDSNNAEFYHKFNDAILLCFQNEAIDYEKVFSLIFYQSSNNMISSKNKNKHISDKEKKKFMESLLTGEADISRNALLFFLMNARATLGNNDNLTNYSGTDKEGFLLFNKDYDELDLGRINYILETAGYTPLSIEDADTTIDELTNQNNLSEEDIIEQLYSLAIAADIEETERISDLIEALISYYENNDIFDYDIVCLKARKSYHRTTELRRQ